jgi:hypothetical protein
MEIAGVKILPEPPDPIRMEAARILKRARRPMNHRDSFIINATQA